MTDDVTGFEDHGRRVVFSVGFEHCLGPEASYDWNSVGHYEVEFSVDW